MNTQHSDFQRKPYTAPTLRKQARIELVTAGSFDLVIPNGTR